MQTNSPLLLLLSFAFVFAPTLTQWLYDGSSAWYRHHLLWLLVIVFIFIQQRNHRRNDL